MASCSMIQRRLSQDQAERCGGSDFESDRFYGSKMVFGQMSQDVCCLFFARSTSTSVQHVRTRVFICSISIRKSIREIWARYCQQPTKYILKLCQGIVRENLLTASSANLSNHIHSFTFFPSVDVRLVFQCDSDCLLPPQSWHAAPLFSC